MKASLLFTQLRRAVSRQLHVDEGIEADPAEHPRAVLIVDGEERSALQAVSPPIESADIHAASSPAEATAMLANIASVALAIVDIDLRARGAVRQEADLLAGIALVQRVVAGFPQARVVAFTECTAPWVVNRLQRVGAEYVHKRGGRQNLRILAEQVRAADTGSRGPAEQFIDRLRESNRLTARQVQVLALHLRGRTREEIALELGISANTLKCHVRSILRTCGVETLDSIVRRFLRAL